MKEKLANRWWVSQREDCGTSPGDIFTCLADSSLNSDFCLKIAGINTEKAAAY